MKRNNHSPKPLLTSYTQIKSTHRKDHHRHGKQPQWPRLPSATRRYPPTAPEYYLPTSKGGISGCSSSPVSDTLLPSRPTTANVDSRGSQSECILVRACL